MAERTITTTGAGCITAPPELAMIRIDARGGGQTPKAARNHATDRATEIRVALETVESPPDTVQPHHYR